jgi:hypothetical protein
MRYRQARALALAAAAGAGCGGAEPRAPDRPAAAQAVAAAERAPAQRSRAVFEDCSTRSEADFPGAYADPANVVVGPLALVGAFYTPPDVIEEFGGNKFPLLVVGGHEVTLQLSRRTHRVAGLGYGPLPQGEVRLRDSHRAVRFVACAHGITFWSGGVVAREPACVPLHVWVDDEPVPRRVMLRMGVRRCA